MIRKLLSGLAAIWLVANVQAAPSGVTLYQHTQYGGYAVKLDAGTYTLPQLAAKGIRNDDVSSLKVASGWKAVLYENDNYSGASLVRTADDADLVNDGWNDRISSVAISKGQGSAFAPPLRVRGSSIVDVNGDVVRLEGFATNDAPSWQKKSYMENWKRDWKINVIRLAMHPDNWLKKSSQEREAYLVKTDNVLKWSREVGLYVVLDGYHESGNTGDVAFHWEDVKAAWKILGDRYKNETHIIWEIYNEPYGKGGGNWDEWAPKATELINIIMANNPVAKAVVVASPNWDTTGYPRTRPIKYDQMILSWHPYTHVYESIDKNSKTWIGSAARYDEKFGYVVKEGIAPVFAGEWNIRWETGYYFTNYGKVLMDYCRDLGISHTWWAYAPYWGDGDLINRPDPEEITELGKWYKSYLLKRPASPSSSFPLR